MSTTDSRKLSWLTLEMYALGELTAPERQAVEAQLEQSPEDRAALQSIQSDPHELPPLVLPARSAPPVAPVTPIRPERLHRTSWGWAFGALAAAAAVLLMWRGEGPQLPPARRSIKGGDLALRVVSSKGSDATSFSPGQRFKVLLTCPPEWAGTFSVVVFQGDERYEPLPDGHSVPCGNGVAWPGAFALDGDLPAQVCVAEREALAGARTASDLADRAVCVRLGPQP